MAKKFDHKAKMEALQEWAKQDGLKKCYIYVAAEYEQPSGRGEIWYDGNCNEGECASLLAEMMRRQPLLKGAVASALECIQQEEPDSKQAD